MALRNLRLVSITSRAKRRFFQTKRIGLARDLVREWLTHDANRRQRITATHNQSPRVYTFRTAKLPFKQQNYPSCCEITADAAKIRSYSEITVTQNITAHAEQLLLRGKITAHAAKLPSGSEITVAQKTTFQVAKLPFT